MSACNKGFKVWFGTAHHFCIHAKDGVHDVSVSFIYINSSPTEQTPLTYAKHNKWYLFGITVPPES